MALYAVPYKFFLAKKTPISQFGAPWQINMKKILKKLRRGTVFKGFLFFYL